MEGDSGEDEEVQSVRTSELPFEQLPNLPPPVIPKIDLGITRVDVMALVPSLSDNKRTGVFSSEQYTQTNSSEIVSVQNVTDMLAATLQDIGQLRKDLNFAHHVLKADYDKRIEQRSLQLFKICQEKVKELEERHQEKVDIIRRSHKTQLLDAINKISGEYKLYYDDIMGGKTGKQEARIRELKHKVSVLEAKLEMNEAETERLKEEMLQKENEKEDTPDLPPSIPLEEALELRETIDKLELELEMAREEAAEKEDAIRKMTRKYESTSNKLEEEKLKLSQLKKQFEDFKVKSQQEKEKATRLAQSRQDALEKDWKEKMMNAEQDAKRKATEEAELQRMRDQATFQQEIERRKAQEDLLREESLKAAANAATSVVGDGELAEMVENLKKENSNIKEELQRLKLEHDKMIQLYETKLEIMQRNFHALRDESFVRKKLENRSGLLHHSTIGYSAAVSAKKPIPPLNPAKVIHPDMESNHHHGADVKKKVHIQLGQQGKPNNKDTPNGTTGSKRFVHLKDHTSSNQSHTNAGFIKTKS